MSKFITDLDKSRPTEFDPVSDGADEIRSIKESLRDTFPYANTALTVSNESIADAVEKVNSGEIGGGGIGEAPSDNTVYGRRNADWVPVPSGDGAGTTKTLFAAVTYDGTSIYGTPNNVAAVQWLAQPENSDIRFARVTFQSGVPNLPQQPNGTLDADLNIQVTPFSNANNSLGLAGVAAACITEITADYVEIAFIQTDETLTWQFVFNQAFCLLVAEN